MGNREAFTGISAEPVESEDEVNWKQKNYNPASRGRGYFNKVLVEFNKEVTTTNPTLLQKEEVTTPVIGVINNVVQ